MMWPTWYTVEDDLINSSFMKLREVELGKLLSKQLVAKLH